MSIPRAFPQRHTSHEMEDESFRIFLSYMDGLVVRELTRRDYGIDCMVEIVRDGLLKGEFLNCQLKSTKTSRRAKISESTLNYLTSSPIPTLFVYINLNDSSLRVGNLRDIRRRTTSQADLHNMLTHVGSKSDFRNEAINTYEYEMQWHPAISNFSYMLYNFYTFSRAVQFYHWPAAHCGKHPEISFTLMGAICGFGIAAKNCLSLIDNSSIRADVKKLVNDALFDEICCRKLLDSPATLVEAVYEIKARMLRDYKIYLSESHSSAYKIISGRFIPDQWDDWTARYFFCEYEEESTRNIWEEREEVRQYGALMGEPFIKFTSKAAKASQ